MLEPTDKWLCELVEPKHPALHRPANIDPFTAPDDADWSKRELCIEIIKYKAKISGLVHLNTNIYIYILRKKK